MSNIDFSKVVTASAQVETIRAARLQELAKLRWQRSCEGVTLPNGATFPGDETTRLSLSGAISALQQGMLTAPIVWKTPTGFVSLSQEDLEAAAAAVVQFIQTCFAAEGAVAAQIEAAPDPAGFDVTAAFDAELVRLGA
ncbi:MAG: hypothetical protein EpisKO_41690 [Epibacterium sp.]